MGTALCPFQKIFSRPRKYRIIKYGLKPSVLQAVISCIGAEKNVEEVILYGSRALGTYKTGSDIDLCLKGNKAGNDEIFRLDEALDELFLPYQFDLSVYGKINNPDLLAHIDRAGIILFKRQDVDYQINKPDTRMETAEKPVLNLLKIIRAFEKIGRGIDPFPLGELEKELLKIQPSEESEVWLTAGYDEEENSVGLSIYVSEPLSEEKPETTGFDSLMQDYLFRTDLECLPGLWKCIERMERREGEKYELDFMDMFYNDETEESYIHGRITKISA